MDDFLSESIKKKMPSVEDLIRNKKTNVEIQKDEWHTFLNNLESTIKYC